MRLVTYLHEGQSRLGIFLDDWVVDLSRAHHLALDKGSAGSKLAVDPVSLSDMMSFLGKGMAALAAARKAVDAARELLILAGEASRWQGIALSPDEISLQPPVLRPGKIICVGLNYPTAGLETAAPSPQYPVLFHKVATTLTGCDQPIVVPKASREVFCEGELAVVIGQRGKHIAEDEALSYVAGYTIANDVGALDLERRTSQWATGKLADTFCPIGPALVTRDEFPDPGALAIRTTLNGQVVQSGCTGDMIFDVPRLVSYISALATLEPGDLILTGSPKKIGDAHAPRVFVRPGDVVSIQIDGLGELTNPVEAEE